MPTYDYHCPANGRTVEVQHPIGERLASWGDVCARAGLTPGGTPVAAPVARLIGASGVVHADSLGSRRERPCDSGPCCGGGVCHPG